MLEIPHGIIDGIYIIITMALGYIGLMIKDKINENNLEIQKSSTKIVEGIGRLAEKMDGHETLDNTRFGDHDRRLNRHDYRLDRLETREEEK